VTFAALVAAGLWAFVKSESDDEFRPRLAYAGSSVVTAVIAILLVAALPFSADPPAQAIGLLLLVVVVFGLGDPRLGLGDPRTDWAATSLLRAMTFGVALGAAEGIAIGLLTGATLA
jgi:hypothetical protein